MGYIQYFELIYIFVWCLNLVFGVDLNFPMRARAGRAPAPSWALASAAKGRRAPWFMPRHERASFHHDIEQRPRVNTRQRKVQTPMSIPAARRSHGITRCRLWPTVEQFPFAVCTSFDGPVDLKFLMWVAGFAFHALKKVSPLRHEHTLKCCKPDS